jgi:flagellar biosynthetic protein FlhB
MFLTAFSLLGTLGVGAFAALRNILVNFWGSAGDIRLEPGNAQFFAQSLFGSLGITFGPFFAALFAGALMILFLQGRPTLAWKRLAPKWSKLNPLSGFSRIFGKQSMVEFLKTLAKFAMISGVAIYVAWPKGRAFDQLIGMGPLAIATSAGGIIMMMLKAVTMLVLALAVADFAYQRFAFRRRMQMSLQELKDEHKSSEGDPHVKQRIRSIQMQSARKRMMAAVPTASVIITNPTHYAVALKYEHGAMRAPVVVAKGTDAVALRIREIATQAGVPIVESPPLARALHATAEIDHPIPVEQYAAVAEIVSYVMALARRKH